MKRTDASASIVKRNMTIIIALVIAASIYFLYGFVFNQTLLGITLGILFPWMISVMALGIMIFYFFYHSRRPNKS